MNEDKAAFATDQHQFPNGKDLLDVPLLTKQLVAAAAYNGWEQHQMSAVHGFERPWFRLPPERPKAPCLYVSSGAHGDESAGPLACLKLLQQTEAFKGCEVIMIPMLNPA